MNKRRTLPTRIHMLAHANPLGPDAARFGLEDIGGYVEFVERHLPEPFRLTRDEELLRAVEDPWRAGRTDDAERIKDINHALKDRHTAAIVAASGGAYFSRILPQLKFEPLAQRTESLWTFGFSEMTTFVNLVASYRCGRGVYWLCPNWISYRVQPAEAARAALAEFWLSMPDLLTGKQPADAQHLVYGPVEGEVTQGRVRSGKIKVVGGCLAVLAAVTGASFARRIRPDGKWLFLEDIKESPYRIDRHLSALKLAGWFEKAAGLLIGDFHMMNNDTQSSVLELLPYHLPRRKVPIITTRMLGHTWPIAPLLLNRPLELEISSGQATLWSAGFRPT